MKIKFPVFKIWFDEPKVVKENHPNEQVYPFVTDEDLLSFYDNKDIKEVIVGDENVDGRV